MRHALLVIVSLLFSSQLALAQFAQQVKLVANNAIGAALQGQSVALSSDGNTAIVGGPDDNSSIGAVWVYTRSGSVWSQQSKLVADNAVGAAHQGFSVALSSDGNTAIVGGSFDNSGIGAAWVWTRSNGVWTEQSKLVGTGAVGAAAQGFSVALSGNGNTAIVGGAIDNSGIGAAWVWTRSDGVWSQQSKLVANNAVGAAQQGFSVALSSDGNTAIVGGLKDNSNVGAAWVWTRSNAAWTQQIKLVANNVVGVIAGQGSSVGLSGDGNTAIVGGPADNLFIGAAWVYTRSNGVWTQQTKLVANNPIGVVAEQGSSVALSSDGNTAIVGGFFDNSGIGAAWVWTRSNGGWSQESKLVANNAVGNAEQGSSTAVSSDGKTAIVGGPTDSSNAGAAWVFVQQVPFSTFSAQLTVYPNQPGFSINANFTLGATSNGINPATQPVTLQIGDFTITIPTGSFVKAGAGYYSFVGVINGVNLNVLIRLTSGSSFIFGVVARNVSLTIVNPVLITLTIGDDSGTTTVNAVIINTG